MLVGGDPPERPMGDNLLIESIKLGPVRLAVAGMKD
jgi:hypothetical protein